MGTKHLRFENVGMGIALAADWIDFDGRKIWVDFMSASEGKGQKRAWHVTANHYPRGIGRNGFRVTISMRDCFRYEATDIAVKELMEQLRHDCQEKLDA